MPRTFSSNRPPEARHPLAERGDPLDPPAAGVGQREESEGLAGRGGVDDDHVVVARVDVVADPEQVAELVHPRQDGHLLGHHLIEPAPREQLRDVVLDRPPVAGDVVVDVRLLTVEVRCDLRRLGAEGRVERVGEAVGDVGREDDRPEPAISAQERGRGGDARLPDAALAGVEEDAGHRLLDRMEGRRILQPAVRSLFDQTRPMSSAGYHGLMGSDHNDPTHEQEIT
jgi:hypothetical protein